MFGKTRQAWYKSIKAKEEKQMQGLLVVDAVKKIRKDLPKCGGRKLHYLLQDFLCSHGIKLGRDHLFDLLSAHNLLIKRRKSHRTTYSLHRYRKYPNIIKEMKVERVNQVWVSDITYISMNGNFLYLTLIMDVYSRKIVGWSLRKDLTAKGPVAALSQALSQRPTNAPLIHHNDRGVQYCCNEYVRILNKNGVKISMTENGDPYENAMAERINRTIKEEFLAYYYYFTYVEAKEAVDRAIKMYNSKRPHLSLDYQTPNERYNNVEIRGKSAEKKPQPYAVLLP